MKLKLCLFITSSVSTLKISFSLYLVDYKHLTVNEWYVYPDWAYALGWMMTLSSVFVVLFTVARQMCSTAGTFRQVSTHLYAAQD